MHMSPDLELLRWFRRAPAPAERGLAWWRQCILDTTLVSALVLGFIAYVPSVFLTVRGGLWPVAVVDSLVYTWILLVAMRRAWPYALRAGSVVAVCFALGVTLIIELGPLGPSMAWLAAAPMMAAILFGLRAAIGGLVVTSGVFAAVGVAIARGALHWPTGPLPRVELTVFAVSALNVMILSAAVSLSLGTLLHGLEQANRDLAREIDDRRRAEIERADMARQLNQAQKLEAIGTLAGGIAHDFNNLLVPILANADLVEQELAPDDPQRRRLADITRSAERARQLVRRILVFSRHAAGQRRAVKLDDVAREINNLIRAAVPPMVRMEFVVSAPETTVFADPTELHQVLMNLCTNASYAMRDLGGTMTIAIAEADDGRSLRLSVYDTGAGMDRETLDRALDPFFTTKPPGEGTGLGLSTVHGIVSDLGGRLELASEVGRGTRVHVVLPKFVASATVAAPAAPVPPAPVSTRRRIMLVDDEPQVLDVCTQVLARAAFEVTAFGDPREALARFQEAPDGFDLLVTDHAMPGMTGIALASEVHRMRPSVPILLASGFVDDGAKRNTDAAGIHHILPKPYTPAELVDAVRRTLHASPA